MAIKRLPNPPLRPFVKTVWAADADGADTGRCERMLPGSSPHVVVRLDDEPVELYADDGSSVLGRMAIGSICGPRWSSYVRRAPAQGRTVGALLRPGATHALLGVPASELAGRHTSLEDLLGARAAPLRDRLAETLSLAEALALFERELLARIGEYSRLHSAVAHALGRLHDEAPVYAVVRESGYSHRRFNEHFRYAVGIAPKLYCRVVRLERLLAEWETDEQTSLAALAVRCGFADQAHLSREFRDLTGMTLTQYRCSTMPGSRHVPLPGHDARRSGSGS